MSARLTGPEGVAGPAQGRPRGSVAERASRKSLLRCVCQARRVLDCRGLVAALVAGLRLAWSAGQAVRWRRLAAAAARVPQQVDVGKLGIASCLP